MEVITAINQYEKNPDGSFKVLTQNNIGKISGTFLAGIVGKSRYQTPFSLACKLLRIYDEKIENASTKAGKYLEPVIMHYLDKSGRLHNTEAEFLFPGFENGAHEDWKPHFDHPIFTGHIDGIVGTVTDPKAGEGILENKTTTHPEDWDFVNGVPPVHYWLQASLYAWALGYKDIYFTVGLLEEDERDDPFLFSPSPMNVKVMHVGLYPNFENILKEATEWYEKYVLNGITPVPNMLNPIDANIVRVLDAQKATVDEVLPKLRKYIDLSKQATELDKQAEVMKQEIMLFLEANKMPGIGSGPESYKYAEYSRKVPDTDKMKADGIYDKYTKDTKYNSLRKGKY